MNKEKFLKELEKKLAVLSEEERRDTINEYRDIIEEKVRHGKTEEEAVKEFGSVNELAKEILNAYKINPDYSKNETKEKTKQIMDDCEDLIKKGAQKLSNVTEEVIDNFKESGKDFTLETAFEIVIKIFIVLLLLAVLRIPFSLLSSFGGSIFGDTFSFFGDWIFRFGWKVLIEIAYLGVCVLLVLAAVNQYVKKDRPTTKNVKKKNPTNTTKNEVKTEHVEKKEVRTQPRKQGVEDTLGVFLLTLVKIFVLVVFLFPLWLVLFGLIIAIGFVIWALVKGIAIWGILLLLCGIFGITAWIADIIFDALFRNKTPHIWPFFIHILLVLIGGFMTFDYVTSFTYIDTLPSDFSIETKVYEETVEGPLEISADQKTFVIDKELADNQVLLKVSYYDDYVDLDTHHYIANGVRNLTFYAEGKDNWNWQKDRYQEWIQFMKDRKWYPFHQLGDVKVEIHVNENTKDLVS